MASLTKNKTKKVESAKTDKVEVNEMKVVNEHKEVEKVNTDGNKNIIHTFSQMKTSNVRMEVPEFGFMMKPKSDSGDAKIRINFQSSDKNFKQTGFGSYYLDSTRMLALVAMIMNGTFDKREEESRKKGGQFPDPMFEDNKPGQGNEYKYLTIVPGMKEGKILIKYVCRDLETKKQLASIQIPMEKEDFIGKMMKIYLEMQKY